VTLRKHLDKNHSIIAKKIEEEMINGPLKRIVERQPTLKIPNLLNINFFGSTNPLKKKWYEVKKPFGQPWPFILKYHFLYNLWGCETFCHVSLSLSCLPFEKVHFTRIVTNLVEKTKHKYWLPMLKNCHFAITSFDLWMFKRNSTWHFCSCH